MAKPWKVRGLVPTTTFRVAARFIVATKYAEMASYREPAVEQHDEVALHDMRIACKRLREAVALLRDVFPPKRVKRARTALDDLNDAMGRVRDCDVFIEWLEAQQASDPSEAEGVMIADLVGSTQRERTESLDALAEMLPQLFDDGLPRALDALTGGLRVRAKGGGAGG